MCDGAEIQHASRQPASARMPAEAPHRAPAIAGLVGNARSAISVATIMNGAPIAIGPATHRPGPELAPDGHDRRAGRVRDARNRDDQRVESDSRELSARDETFSPRHRFAEAGRGATARERPERRRSAMSPADDSRRDHHGCPPRRGRAGRHEEPSGTSSPSSVAMVASGSGRSGVERGPTILFAIAAHRTKPAYSSRRLPQQRAHERRGTARAVNFAASGLTPAARRFP